MVVAGHDPITTAKKLLEARAAAVDAALDRYLPGADEPPVEVHRAMRHSVFAGGKRLRPALTLTACAVAQEEAKSRADPLHRSIHDCRTSSP